MVRYPFAMAVGFLLLIGGPSWHHWSKHDPDSSLEPMVLNYRFVATLGVVLVIASLTPVHL